MSFKRVIVVTGVKHRYDINLRLTGIEKIDNWRRWMVYQRLAVELDVKPEDLWLWDRLTYECQQWGEA